MSEKDNLYEQGLIKRKAYEHCVYCKKEIDYKQKTSYWKNDIYHKKCLDEKLYGKQTIFIFR